MPPTMVDASTRKTIYDYYQQEAYVRVAEEHSHHARPKHLAVLQEHLDPKAVVAELGCGIGVFSDVSERYLGLDLSLPALRKLKARGRWAVCCDIAHLPLKPGAAGACFSFETLEHVHDPQRVLEEVERALGPRGLALLKDAWLKTEMHVGVLPRGLRKVLGNIGSRFRRLWREISGNNDVARWPLVPDYSQIAGDHDAVSRIDAHSVFRFFRARGFESLNEYPGFLMRILRLWTRNRHWVIVRRK